MDIDNITLQILSDKPKPKFTYALNLDINTNLNQQYEIMTLMFLRTVEEKIIKEIKNIKDVKELKSKILKQLFITKFYLNSCGIELKYTNLERKNCINYNLANTCIFYSKNRYNTLFCIVKKIFRKGKKLETYYNMKNLENFNELFIIIKIKNHFFKIELDLLKK